MKISHKPAVTATPQQCWRSNSPTSLIRAPLRFTSDEDRQHFHRGVRMLGLAYAGILMLVIAITTLRGQWHKQDVTAKVTTGASASGIPGR
jgi:hypothetical protein